MAILYDKERVFALLDEAGAVYHVQTHGAVHTLAEVDSAGVQREGIVLKNLFLKDGKGRQHFLVCVPETKRIDLKQLGEQLETKKLGLASSERLEKFLGVTQGAVSPFNSLNDAEKAVKVVFDRDMPDDTVVGVHPNDTSASIWMKHGDIIHLLKQHGSEIVFIDLTGAQ